jgi:hypothetical protein
LVFGTWFLVFGTWFLVLGSWFLVLGSWFLVLGSWYLVLGIWYLVKRYDPLPTDASAEGYKVEKTSKMPPIRPAKTTEKWLRQLCRQYCRIAL